MIKYGTEQREHRDDLSQPLLCLITESQNSRGWKGPLWVI